MNILVLNGSPKGKKSNTLQLTKAFLQGFSARRPAAIDWLDISDAAIEPCKGCFGCWTATPGRCVIKDDMADILERILKADLLVWSFPLYYFGIPSKAKALLDRTLPHLLPFMTQREDGSATHPSRYPQHQPAVVLISTCGFYSLENNYEALEKQFSILYGSRCTNIFCPEGELFSHRELAGRCAQYLAVVEQAGAEYAASGAIAKETKAQLAEKLFPPKAFVQMADANWDIRDTAGGGELGTGDEQAALRDTALRFTTQMAATYNPSSFKGRDTVVEIHYTDADLTCRLVLGKEECLLQTEGFSGPSIVRIETPYTVWKAIADGEYSGPQALMEKKYKVVGSLQFMSEWDRYFYGNSAGYIPAPAEENAKKTNLPLLILIWFPVWALLPIHPVLGGAAAVGAAALAQLARHKWAFTLYDTLSGIFVSAIGLAALLGASTQWLVPLSYLLFGSMWLSSCAFKIPLTAHYSKNSYGGNSALRNPLFIKTNRILTACWGVLYLAVAVWTLLLMATPFASFSGLLNAVCPAILGLFTLWFQKWYPSKLAAGA